MYSVQIVHCTMYNVRSELYVQCKWQSYEVRCVTICTGYIVQCTMYNIQCTAHKSTIKLQYVNELLKRINTRLQV